MHYKKVYSSQETIVMYFACECPTLYTGQWVSNKLYYYDITILIKMATLMREWLARKQQNIERFFFLAK